MISNAKIRINLKEANEQAKKSLTNPKKRPRDTEIISKMSLTL